MVETADRIAVRILGYCIVPNHWHMVLWPTRDGELGPVCAAMMAKELERLRSSAQRGQPYGSESWADVDRERLGLESTLRARGRGVRRCRGVRRAVEQFPQVCTQPLTLATEGHRTFQQLKPDTRHNYLNF